MSKTCAPTWGSQPGVGQFAYGWRESDLSVGAVTVVPANFGTAGSQSRWRDRQTDVVIAPPDPRMRRWNGLLPAFFRNRVPNTAEVDAVAAPTAPTNTTSLNYTAPRGASLLKQ